MYDRQRSVPNDVDPSELEPNPERADRNILKKKIGDIATFYRYDDEGRLYSVFSARTESMFTMQDFIDVGWMRPIGP